MISSSRMITQADGSSFGMNFQRERPPKLRVIGAFGCPLIFRFPPLVSKRGALLTVARRHSGQANVLLADGRVEQETLQQTLYPSVENWTRFNYDNKKHWDSMPSSSG